MYKIKEIYNTIQCEGFQTGRVAIFCRFTGCNLWSGREEDRSKAICNFCDTDFIGVDGQNGGKYTAESLADKFDELWQGNDGHKFVVFTGGEPLLQLDENLIQVMHDNGYSIAIETNGTIEPPQDIDWVCVSPKSNTEIKITKADELKIVFPQSDLHPDSFNDFNADHFYIQPMENSFTKENTAKAIQFCKENPKWKLSIQMHKYLGID